MKRSKAVGKVAGEAPGKSSKAEAGGLGMVRELARIATEFDLAEIELDPSGHVRLTRRTANMATAMAAAGAGPSSPAALALMPQSKPEPAADEGSTFITSPFVGTFYRAASPEAALFTDAGQKVRKGQVVCIIEAMKLMNEIESEAEGTVAEVLVKNGEHVEYGQKLFRLSK
jgi:acetyl-CoA carboxylase biotin carboxyl carrier protein